MSRSEILRQERERVMLQLSQENHNRAKLLTALMDIDDEIEEMRLKSGVKKENKDELTA
jgi:hypothetical protein